MIDVGIIGSGIIGLSVARELAARGLSVLVLGRERPRKTASWAAAGIFPPAPDVPGASPGDRLTAFSDRLHQVWREELLEETGIDNGLAACGGLYLATDAEGLQRLEADTRRWRERGVRCKPLAPAEIAADEPQLAAAVENGLLAAGMLLPEECQIRPPRHLEALEASCRRRGVAIVNDAVQSIDLEGSRIAAVHGAASGYRAGNWVLATGAWAEDLSAAFGATLSSRPVRGQIALLAMPKPPLARVINVGLEYLVPRPDGRVLVGSTLEEVGFRQETSPEAVDRLLRFAHRLVPSLVEARLEARWAGLRPGSPDGLPWIGRSPRCENGFVAAGHFRAGLHQSTGTARLLADLITGGTPELDLAAFAPGRNPDSGHGQDSLAAYLEQAARDAASRSWADPTESRSPGST
jgi:glycine oxidase